MSLVYQFLFKAKEASVVLQFEDVLYLIFLKLKICSIYEVLIITPMEGTKIIPLKMRHANVKALPYPMPPFDDN